MKKTVFIILMLCSIHSFAQTWDEVIYQGKKERADGNFEKAAGLIARGARLKGKDNFEHYYYAAIMYANAHRLDSSFIQLDNAIEAGMYDWARWERNKRLNLLRADARWDHLKRKMQKTEKKYTATLSHPELRAELKQMWKNDQDLVGKWDEQRKIIDQNTIRLNEIIERYGWPTRSMIGKDGTWMAWAIAQHAHNLDFQRKCLKLLASNLHTEDAEPVLYAELYDRICRNTDQKQKYGMAIIEENGVKHFYPIEQESAVDKRRKSIGLEPLKVYANENFVAYDNNHLR